MQLVDRLNTLAPAIRRLAAQYGAEDIRVFGSVARGEERADSDVDLLVRMQPGRTLFDLGGLQMDLQDLLGCSVDVVSERGLRGPVGHRILQEARVLVSTHRE